MVLVVDGAVRVALDHDRLRGNVVATTVGRQLDQPWVPPADPAAVGDRPPPCLQRWRPTSTVVLPVVADGGPDALLLAASYTHALDRDDVAAARWAAHVCALTLALRLAQGRTVRAEAAIDAAADPLVALDGAGRVALWNAAAERVLGVLADDAVGRPLADSMSMQFEQSAAWAQSRGLPITPVVVGVVDRGATTAISLHDRSPMAIAEHEIQHQQRLSTVVFESMPGRACLLDHEGIIVAGNSRFRKEGPLGRGARSALHVGDDYLAWLQKVDASFRRDVEDLLDGSAHSARRELETTLRRRQLWTDVSATRSDADGVSVLLLHTDITERKRSELDLQRKATHDPLTGLPNRVLLVDRLTHALSRAARTHGSVGVLFCDLDGFKDINTRFGHQAGDELLITVGKRLRQACRTSDTVARVSGDEFVILLEDVNEPSELEEVASRVLATLAEPIELNGETATVGVSIGMVLSPGIPRAGLPSVQKLVRQVDAAMYAAKDAGRNRYAWFSPEMLEKPERRPNFMQALSRRLLNR